MDINTIEEWIKAGKPEGYAITASSRRMIIYDVDMVGSLNIPFVRTKRGWVQVQKSTPVYQVLPKGGNP